MRRNLKSKLIAVFLTSIFLSAPINAFVLKNHDEVSLDTSIVRTDLSFSNPEQILVVPLYFKADSNNLDSTEKFRGLYYYLIQKLGFSDIPFHYVVSEKGDIFKGNLGGDERKVQVEGIGTNTILIGYLGGSLKNEFDPRSLNSLQELLLNVSNTNSINPSKTKISKLKFVRDEITKSVIMKSEEIENSWKGALNEIINKYQNNYSPIEKKYKVSAEIINLEKKEVDPGSENIISIKIKNIGENGIYGGSNSSLILSKVDGSTSKFFLNNEWLSKSQVGVMVEGQNLLPGKEDIFEIKLKAPLVFGDVKEDFILTSLSSGKVESSPLNIPLTMKKGDKRIIEIGNTELGYLKVRSEPSTVGNEIGKVSTGERFFVLEDAGNGYVKIDTNDGKTGWVAGWLTKNIQ